MAKEKTLEDLFYGGLKRRAQMLGVKNAVKLLGATLKEEFRTDESLSALADATANDKALPAAAS